MSILGIFIREHREKLKISRRALSELANISHTEIYRLEKGERKNPSPPLLKSIANALNVRYEDIMEAAGYLAPKPVKEINATRMPYAADLDEDELKQVQTFIEFLRTKRK